MKTLDPVFQKQELFRKEVVAGSLRSPGLQGQSSAVSAGKHVQHHRSLGDEPPLPPGQVALADIAKLADARIGGIVDPDQLAHNLHHRPVDYCVPTVTSAIMRPARTSKISARSTPSLPLP